MWEIHTLPLPCSTLVYFGCVLLWIGSVIIDNLQECRKLKFVVVVVVVIVVCVCVGGVGGAGGLCVYVCVGKILWSASSNILEAMVTILCWTLDRTSVLDGYLLFYQINNSFSFIELG